ncbi:AI-2E family transporter [Ponticoccus sp. SC2-23]|uniref:AI-2E family transporter n=1 Tax=Alexandriicola marinus TaxID=2081710 RepID=UPI000FD8C40D|nr:AI-2E family transporter [Alexandriicola marinus]MBM1219665.1 AI-2E family transporter [Ponticoccus sp. SC6-9]MBM1223263.1 AI-2E family transporter [Ponticoccus sp. SC6-15]MBM1229478.1 AI-2E family transporter [Ponticoccus sp. SC6-38]MBM1232229.1 AI-2E family transporter [Ponticoccus sp. SC6-45]MBM1237821.1 AI-2E family transporter [Ponticoccus sp. SC6-49]MBM1241240.1 AI-2E family transporter [Ponticoccus sp. SC2-64]MBM1245753.1 AI-2E family transporter [Ponticoccus sp. SC6-42]MBM1250231
MALPVQVQLRYWGIAALVLFLALWFFGDVILPFVLGGAIAYCLDPIADRLERAGLGRTASVVLITIVAVLLFVLLILLVIPLLISQAGQLVNTAPDLFRSLQAWLTERFPGVMEDGSPIRQQIAAIGDTIAAKGGELLNRIFNSALGVINVAVLFIIVPVVAFYLLLDWDRMVARLDDLLPRDHAPVIRNLARDIDRTLASFIRGQGLVCLILGTYYAVALMLIGLNFGLVIGATAGLVTFIPYVGALIGGVLAVGLALFQFWGEWWWIVAVAVVFQLGQFVEGNILTPKLVGGSVGLHPVWLLLALSLFGAMFGFVGLLVAVPVAAMLGVLTRFGLDQYKSSLLYRGSEGATEAPPPVQEESGDA